MLMAFTLTDVVRLDFRKQLEVDDLEAEDHDEETAKNGVRHIEEEVAVVEVPNAAVDPRAMVVHL